MPDEGQLSSAGLAVRRSRLASQTQPLAHSAQQQIQQQQQQPARGASLHVSWLLEFTDARMEAGYRQYTRDMEHMADVCIMTVNTLVISLNFIKQHTSTSAGGGGANPRGEPWHSSALSLLSAAQSLALLALLTFARSGYSRWRATAISVTRLQRLLVWCWYLPDGAAAASLYWKSFMLRVFLMSPAGGSVWFALFFPLPLRTHISIQAATVMAAIWRGEQLCGKLLEGDAVDADQAMRSFRAVNRVMRRFQLLPTSQLLPRLLPAAAAAAELGTADVVWCMFAFVAVVYGLLFPAMFLYVKEARFRIRYLGTLTPTLAPDAMRGTRNLLLSITSAACVLILSLIPSVWGMLHLIPAVCVGTCVRGVLTVLGTLVMEVFMRLWALSLLEALLKPLL